MAKDEDDDDDEDLDEVEDDDAASSSGAPEPSSPQTGLGKPAVFVIGVAVGILATVLFQSFGLSSPRSSTASSAAPFTASKTAPRWLGWVYPARNNLARHLELGAFDSLDTCRVAAHRKLQSLHDERCSRCNDDSDDSRCRDCDDDPLQSGDYECGSDCKLEDDGIYTCKETLR